MPISASHLRADVYRILDHAIATGEPVEIERNGRIVQLVPPSAASWVDRLPRRAGVVVGDPDALVSIDWLPHWKPEPL